MILKFDKTLRDWAEEYYIDFEYIAISLYADENRITLSEYEKSTKGEDYWACMYSFYKYPKNDYYTYINYENGFSKEYKKLFKEIKRETIICRVDTESLVTYLRDNKADEYIMEYKDDKFSINDIDIKTFGQDDDK